jgi:Hemerythrin HHE cation binding domain.
VAAVGLLPPTAGALLQEAIDVTVIVNALRALRPGWGGRRGLDAPAKTLLLRFEDEHARLRPPLDLIRQVADGIGTEPPEATLAGLRRVRAFLTDELLPHEQAEENHLYPIVDRLLRDPEATMTMSRAHAEIDRLAHRLGQHLDLAATGVTADQFDDLRACLYGLHAVLILHFAQEEEAYFSLAAK